MKWGFLGCGRIANDFGNALKSVQDAELYACAARNIDSANALREAIGVHIAYGSYEEMCKDENVEIVYVNTIHTMHYEHACLAIKYGKHVLVEKPMTMTLEDTVALVKFAKQKNVFLMEAMWTRFFPIVDLARECIQKGDIGTVLAINADFGVRMEQTQRRVWEKQLGGGALLDIGVYPIAYVPMVFPNEQPDKISAIGKLSDQNVDVYANLTIEYTKDRLATVQTSLVATTAEVVHVTGTNGSITIHSPSHCPHSMTIVRGKIAEQISKPLPKSDLFFNYPGGIGFQYEAASVQECIKKGLIQNPKYTLQESITVANILQSSLNQLGYQS